MPNFTLLDAAIAEIEAHPETWDQSTWHCGTTYCLAGHIARLGGYRLPTVAEVGSDSAVEHTSMLIHPETNQPVAINFAANELLGFDAEFYVADDGQAYDLFNAANSIEDIREIAAIIKADMKVDA